MLNTCQPLRTILTFDSKTSLSWISPRWIFETFSTNLSECEPPSSNVSSTPKATMKPVMHFMHTDGQIFEQRAVSVFRNFGEKWSLKLLLLTFSTTHLAEQGFCQVLHMRNKYRDHRDMNKTGGNAIQLKLTSLQPTLKNLADKHQAPRFTLVATSYFLDITTLVLQMHSLFVCCVLC